MKRVYRIRWRHPNSKRTFTGPILRHLFSKKLYTEEEAFRICTRLNKNSKAVHSITYETMVEE